MVLKDVLKYAAAKLPFRWQQELKRIHFQRMIARRKFFTDEPEYKKLPEWLSVGDHVIDVGANVGHYTLRLSELVGHEGRVFAFEPIPQSFELLAANVRASGAENVTLINAALSDTTKLSNMTIPQFASGLDNYYEARIDENTKGIQVLCIAADGIDWPSPIKLVKIDAEGHDFLVLLGMRRLIGRDRPIVIIEGHSCTFDKIFDPLRYEKLCLPNSPNTCFVPSPASDVERV